jgi:type II secretory ATPase GspE/PulE/Tfp pilus assembly ATPase PilB-like protein
MIQEKAIIQAALDEGLVNDADVSEARKMARRDRKGILSTLSFSHRIPIVSFYRAYAQRHGFKFLNAADLRPNIKFARKCSFGMMQSRRIFPIIVDNDQDVRVIACVTAPDTGLMRQLERTLGGEVEYCLADSKAIDAAIRQIEPVLNPLLDVIENKNDEIEFNPVSEVDEILDQAYLHRASDVHIEPIKEQTIIRLRVDGSLQEYSNRYSREQGNGLISRIKVLSQLDIAETRMPQDGGMSHRIENGVEFDLRVATMPTRFGERVTLRLLGADTQILSLKKIGMDDEELQLFSDTIRQPHGMILITGPTGSGKSTTLYAALQEINSDDINILTAEDPVEQSIETISQLQVGVKVSFASALRSFLRHDPDVIMVGEIRDSETADVAMKAALTGHLVFSTLHTNTAVACINRLRDLGTEPYLIASTLLAAIAQRLARRICENCKTSFLPDKQLIDELSLSTEEQSILFQSEGCAHCSNTGYRGRIALFETLWIDNKIKQVISQGASEQEICDMAENFTSLAKDGRRKFIQGLTSQQELKRLALIR